MSFKRYDGFEGSVPQKKMDNGLPRCPFCGEHPHWLLDLQVGLTSTMTCMCEKCGAKLYSENRGFSFDDYMRIVDVGNKNLNNLPLNASYHIQSLNTIAQKISFNSNQQYNAYTSEFEETNIMYAQPYTGERYNKKAIITTVAAITIIVLIGLIILLPGSANNGNALEPVQKSTMNVEKLAGYYYVTITGSAKNTTRRTMSYVSITFTLYDSAGNVVGTALTNQAGLKAGKTWVYSATGISQSKPTSHESTDVTILYD